MKEKPENICEFGSDALKSSIFGLTIECPMHGNPSDCPLHSIRLLLLKERNEWVKSLSHEECETIYENHKECIYKKENM